MTDIKPQHHGECIHWDDQSQGMCDCGLESSALAGIVRPSEPQEKDEDDYARVESLPKPDQQSELPRLSVVYVEGHDGKHVAAPCQISGCQYDESRWLPMPCAPKDRPVLLYAREREHDLFGHGYYWKGVPGDGEAWITAVLWTEPKSARGGIFTPTHWMPLPNPPAAILPSSAQEQGSACTCQIDAHDFDCPKHNARPSGASKTEDGSPSHPLRAIE